MSDIHDRAGVEDVLWRALKGLGEVLSERALGDLAILIRVGEHLVAYEIIATQVYEFSVPLDAELVADLRVTGAALSADPKYAEWIAESAVEG